MAGREFDDKDGAEAPRVAVVNEAFARKFGLGREAVGKWMRSNGRDGELDTQIVGLVQDAKYSDVRTSCSRFSSVPIGRTTASLR